LSIYKRRIRFIHTSDLHLGSPFSGLSQNNNNIAEYLSKATHLAFETIVEKCIEENIDFLLISGDVFDSEEKNLRAVLQFMEAIKKLSQNGIPTYIAPGNHDPYPSWEYILKVTDNERITVFPPEIVDGIYIKKNEDRIALLYGIGFSKVTITENLSKKFPKRDDFSVPVIGTLHCNVGSISDQENYAPCTVNDLVSLGYDYWALGHIHAKREVRKENPAILYSGNPQGKSSKENGSKSCTLVTIETNGDISWKYIDTDVIRWEKLFIDISNVENEIELASIIDDKLTLLSQTEPDKSKIISIILTGSSSLHYTINGPSVLDDILESFQTNTYITPFCYPGKIINKTTIPINREEFRDSKGIIGEIISVIDLLISEHEQNSIQDSLSPLFDHKIMKNANLDSLSEEEKMSLIYRAESLLLEKMRVNYED